MDNLIKNVIDNYNIHDLEELHELLTYLYPSTVVNYFLNNQLKFKGMLGD